MNIKIGDTVRFLDSVGGGKVVRIKDRIAYVEEEDGFETPVLINDCVVVSSASATENTASRSESKAQTSKYDEVAVGHKTEVPVSAIVEMPGGDHLNIVLGFEPQDIKSLGSTGFDAYLVNDSNYWLYVTIASRSRDGQQWTLRFDGLIEPNMQEFVWELDQSGLSETDRLSVCAISFKRGRQFASKPSVSVDLKFDATKFMRLHCFRPHRYFDSPVIVYDIVRNDIPVSGFEPDADSIMAGMKEKMRAVAAQDRTISSRSSKAQHETLVVDLHASELFDTTAGLSASDILNAQVEHFCNVMNENMRRYGRKIVFIHGKGEGVLRQAIMKELTHRYKGHDVQDASFAEYGFGATQVTIRPNAVQNVPHRKKDRK